MSELKAETTLVQLLIRPVKQTCLRNNAPYRCDKDRVTTRKTRIYIFNLYPKVHLTRRDISSCVVSYQLEFELLAHHGL